MISENPSKAFAGKRSDGISGGNTASYYRTCQQVIKIVVLALHFYKDSCLTSAIQINL
jgi:hypothetical protein